MLMLSVAAVFALLPAVASAKTKTNTFSHCVSGAAPLLDHTSSSLSMNVPIPKDGRKPQLGATSALTVGIRATHTSDQDLALVLVAPDGNAYSVVVHRGGLGQGYGSGSADCSGSLVRFSDAFTTPISSVGDPAPGPITGDFKPEFPFANLTNLTRTFGLWTLMGTDFLADDSGAINAFSLDLTYSYKTLKKKK